MDQDWLKRNSWTQQTSTLNSKASTSGYKAFEENIELTDRHKKTTSSSQTETILPADTTSTKISNGPILQPRKIIKSFKLTTRPLGFNLTITETTKSQQTPAYFAVSTEFKRNRPDIVLHAGENKDGHRLAVAYYRFSRHIRMGFGAEALTTGEGMWEQMRNTSSYLGHRRYEFEYNVPPDQPEFSPDVGAGAGRTRTKFMWERTRDEVDGVEGVIEQCAGWRNYRLIEEDTGRVLAVMLVSMFTGWSNKGVINLHEPMSKEMEQVVIMTATCICDKGERRIAHYACGGAGGGS